MGNSTTPTQKNSELGQLSALTFQLHSRPPPTPSLLNPTGSCGVDRRPVSVSIWLSLSLLPLLSAVHWGSPRLEGLLIPISPLDTGPAMNLRESRGESLCSGRGYGEGRRRAVGREEKEKRKEKETNQKRLGRIGVGQRGGGGNEEEQTEMEWGALIQFGSFSYFSYPFSSVQSFVSAFRNALFDWQPVTDQLPPKAAWQREVTAQEGI